MDDLTKEFLQESSENLDRLDQDFVKLESDPGNPELVKSIFRTIHTIKGTCGFLGFTQLESVAPLAFAFGGLAQLITGILEFANGNTFGTVAFTSYGAFWLWYASLVWSVGAGWMKAPAAVGVAVVLTMWGVFTLYMWICTFKVNKGLFVIFLLLAVTFFLLAAGDFGWTLGKHAGGSQGWRQPRLRCTCRSRKC